MQMWLTFYCCQVQKLPRAGWQRISKHWRCPGNLSPLCPADGWSHMFLSSVLADVGLGRGASAAELQQELLATQK